MKIIKFIPNLLTLGNLSLGVIGIFIVLAEPDADKSTVSYLIFGAAVLDFLDGATAKVLKAQSAIGAQLDSLADLITFGLLPGFIYWSFIQDHQYNWLLLLVPICSAWRLAKFNISTDQGDSFKGISTTAHGLFVAALLILISNTKLPSDEWLSQPNVLLGIAIFFSFLMVSNLRMLSLKFSNLRLKENWDRYLLLIGIFLLLLILGWSSTPFIMLLYLGLSLFKHYTSKKS